MSKQWNISPLYLEHGMCANDGSIVVMEGDGFDAEPVANVLPTVPIKRSQGHKLTDDKRRDDRARLIAAAPDLLEALKAYMHAMEGFAEAVRAVTGTAYPWEAQDIERAKALAALSKAEGK